MVRNTRSSTSDRSSSYSSSESPGIGTPQYELANKLTRLVASFTFNIDENADIRIQLPWNFGTFLTDVPRRLGYNEALDAACEVLVAAYANFVAGRVVGSADVVMKHSNALSALRRCLDDPIKAYSSETLCSTMILIIVQVCDFGYSACLLADVLQDVARRGRPTVPKTFCGCGSSLKKSRIYRPEGRIREQAFTIVERPSSRLSHNYSRTAN